MQALLRAEEEQRSVVGMDTDCLPPDRCQPLAGRDRDRHIEGREQDRREGEGRRRLNCWR